MGMNLPTKMDSDEVSDCLASLKTVLHLMLKAAFERQTIFFFLCMQLQHPESVYPRPLLCNRLPISECSEHQ